MPPTALVLLAPELEPLVSRWRADLDPSARRGVPAHLSVLYPWVPADALDDELLADLTDLAAAHAPVALRFDGFDRFAHTLWLDPVPAEPLQALTLAVAARWPDYPPYEGKFDLVVPHPTVADSVDPDDLAHVVSDVAPQLPVETTLTHLTLLLHEGARWSVHSPYPLGG